MRYTEALTAALKETSPPTVKTAHCTGYSCIFGCTPQTHRERSAVIRTCRKHAIADHDAVWMQVTETLRSSALYYYELAQLWKEPTSQEFYDVERAAAWGEFRGLTKSRPCFYRTLLYGPESAEETKDFLRASRDVLVLTSNSAKATYLNENGQPALYGFPEGLATFTAAGQSNLVMALEDIYHNPSFGTAVMHLQRLVAPGGYFVLEMPSYLESTFEEVREHFPLMLIGASPAAVKHYMTRFKALNFVAMIYAGCGRRWYVYQRRAFE